MQLIKAKPPNDDSIPYMTDHLEKILEDSMTYTWEGVRQWSEEISTRVSLGRLKWSDVYIIDRLQTQTSHKTFIDKTQKQTSASRSDFSYEMSDEIRRAKPGPPCKFYQNGNCNHSGDHVQKGYRQQHLCTYCLVNKCLLLQHSSKDCKTKKFNEQRKSQNDPGFGN